MNHISNFEPDRRVCVSVMKIFQSDDSDTSLRFSACDHSISKVHVLPARYTVDPATRIITNPTLCIICSVLQTEKRAALVKEKYDHLKRVQCIDFNTKLWEMEDENEKEGIMRAFKAAISRFDVMMEVELNAVWRPFVETWGGAMKTTTREVFHLRLEKKDAKKWVVGEWKEFSEDVGMGK
jgi:hypothetical protein